MLKKLISAFALALACVFLLQTPEAEAGGGSSKQSNKSFKVYLKNTCSDSLFVEVSTTPGPPPTFILGGPLASASFKISTNRAYYVRAVPSDSPVGTPLCVDQSYPKQSANTPVYILIDCISGARVVSQKEWNAATPCT